MKRKVEVLRTSALKLIEHNGIFDHILRLKATTKWMEEVAEKRKSTTEGDSATELTTSKKCYKEDRIYINRKPQKGEK